MRGLSSTEQSRGKFSFSLTFTLIFKITLWRINGIYGLKGCKTPRRLQRLQQNVFLNHHTHTQTHTHKFAYNCIDTNSDPECEEKIQGMNQLIRCSIGHQLENKRQPVRTSGERVCWDCFCVRVCVFVTWFFMALNYCLCPVLFSRGWTGGEAGHHQHSKCDTWSRLSAGFHTNNRYIRL